MEITLLAVNHKLVCAEEGGGGTGIVNARSDPAKGVGPWETWTEESADQNDPKRVSLRSCDGFYLTALENGTVQCNREEVNAWEVWERVNTPRSPMVSYRSVHNKFLCCDLAFPVESKDPRWTGHRIVADRQEIGAYEQFLLNVLDPDPLVPSTDPLIWSGAFCIPNCFDIIQGGDGHRLWSPALATYTLDSKKRILQAYRDRGYSHFEYLVSGKPYRDDYGSIPVNANRTIDDLVMIKEAGLITVLAFDDARGPELAYLQEIASLTQTLVPWVMGIYEVNGVFQNDYQTVTGVLLQTRALWPQARLGVHLTPQDVGFVGFGGAEWWNQVAREPIHLDAYLFQTAKWNEPLEAIARCQDYQRRLGSGFNGYPKLPGGVVAFELSTTMTYNNRWTEQQGVELGDQFMEAPLVTLPGPGGTPAPLAGFNDGGTPRRVVAGVGVAGSLPVV